jgi:hypothetical protein
MRLQVMRRLGTYREDDHVGLLLPGRSLENHIASMLEIGSFLCASVAELDESKGERLECGDRHNGCSHWSGQSGSNIQLAGK